MRLAIGLILAAALMGQDPAPAPAPAQSPAVPGPVAPPAPVVPLTAVRTVYIMPMPLGFDQYLANQLTRSGVVQVVVDPAQADAVITAQVGESFEEKLEELYPPPAKPAEESADADSSRRDDAPRWARGSGFNRGRGNVFLVDPHSRRVLWSTWQPPKSMAAKDLDKAAQSVVKRLTSDVKNPAN
jgi:hypothetical protein